MAAPRTLRTVLFTDIVGSTQKAAALGDSAWSDLLHRYHEIARHEVVRRGGEIAGSTGDGTVAIFEGPTPAILAVCAIGEVLREHGLEIRAGIHMGEVVRSGTAIEGIGVHIASRVTDEAAPGEILVSSTVHDTEVGSDFAFEDRGVQILKGVPGEWRLYAVTGGPTDAADKTSIPSLPVQRRRTFAIAAAALAVLAALTYLVLGDRNQLAPEAVVAGSAEPGIAILPFTVNDPELDRWREGMVDLLSTNLDGVAGLRAIDSRTVLSRWGREFSEDDAVDLATALGVARETGARYGLVGSVVSSGADIRLVAEVYDLEGTQRSLGEDQVQGSPDSIFGLIDRLSLALLDRILEEEGTSLHTVDLSDITTSSIPGLKAFLEGESLLRRSRFGEAADAYENAVTADSTFALAWFRLAESAAWIENIGVTQTDVGDTRQKAWALRERLPLRERRLLEVTIAEQVDGRADAAEMARETANEYPDDPRAWYLLGEALHHLSHQTSPNRDEREAPFRRAVELDPLFTPAYIHLLDIAFQYADSSGVARLMSDYERGAGGSTFDRQYRLAIGLVWGHSEARASIIAALDTIPSADVARAVSLLDHPRLLDVQEQLVGELARRPDVSRSFVNEMAALNRLRQGKFRNAIEIALDPATDRGTRYYILWFVYLMERGKLLESAPIEDLVLAREFSLPYPNEEEVGPGRLFRAAAYAVDNRRDADYENAIQALERMVEDASRRGDSLNARAAMEALEVGRGYEAASRGRLDDGIRLLEHAYRSGGNIALRPALLVFLARAGRTDETGALVGERVPETYAGSLAGPLFERAGRRDQALEAWQWVVDGWDEADPELQPKVIEAEQGIARVRATDGS